MGEEKQVVKRPQSSTESEEEVSTANRFQIASAFADP